MKVYIKYTILAIASFLWFLGCSPSVSRYLYDKGFIKDDYRYGDLYRFCNLKQFRVPVDKCEKPITSKNNLPINFYLVGDSFTEPSRISNKDFAAQKYTYANMGDVATYTIDSSKKNILVIETVERHTRERFSSPWLNLKDNKTYKEPLTKLSKKILAKKLPYSSELHESVLFSSDFFLSIKEFKAAINQKFFGHVDAKVRISKNGEHLLYAMDTEPGVHSIFDPITDSQIEILVDNINKTYEYYKSQGFDEVYLSIIPNKSTLFIQNEGKYNHLIERIENSKNIRMPVISTYSDLLKNGSQLYDIGDTHWNCKGKKIWIDKVNSKLLNLN